MEALTAGEPFYLGPVDSSAVAIHLSTSAHGIARIYGTSIFECRERAAQIVRAVNAHDSLVEACELALESLQYMPPPPRQPDCDARDACRAALANAKPKGE